MFLSGANIFDEEESTVIVTVKMLTASKIGKEATSVEIAQRNRHCREAEAGFRSLSIAILRQYSSWSFGTMSLTFIM